MEEYLVIVVRQLDLHIPVVTEIRKVKSEVDCIEDYAKEIMEEVEENLCKEFTELRRAVWHVQIERPNFINNYT